MRVRRKEQRHACYLVALVCGAVVLVDHAELVGEPEQALGMAHEQISVGIQAAVELLHQPFLLGFVEIDHHVAAEDDVVALRQEFGLQVMKVEVDEFLDATS